MRRDMHKVIVERPRVGGRRARKGRPPRDLEDHLAKEGIGRPYLADSKALNEHLGPLRRFLRKQLGRPWNKVYSEICEGLRAGNALGDHVRKHLFDYVTLENLNLPRAKRRYRLFYVDARTGILRLTKPSDR